MSSFNFLWEGKAYHSFYTNNSRGASILTNKNTQHGILKKYTGNKRNYIILECKINTDIYFVGRIYGPKRDEPLFYEQIGRTLETANYDHIILGGDFSTEKDCYGYVREYVNAKKKLLSFCNNYNLTRHMAR